MSFEELREYLDEYIKDNLTIDIERHAGYYNYPHLEVKLKLHGKVISCETCTIYDGDRS